MDGMVVVDRRERTLEILFERGRVSTGELARLFGVSDVTVRGDLARMAQQGLIVRTHGGASLPNRQRMEFSFSAREGTRVELKRRIGTAAAVMLVGHHSAMLDASTTALQIAKAIRHQPPDELTIITNGVNTALELLGAPGITTILTGGVVRETAVSLTGPMARELLSKVRAGVGFFGGQGLNVRDGLTDVNIQEAEMKAAMVAACQIVVAVVDHTKLGEAALASFASVSEIDIVITDDQAPPESLAELRRAGVEIRLV